jgi:hypothetical protein
MFCSVKELACLLADNAIKTAAVAVGFSLAGAASAFALPQFTLDPAAAGLTGAAFTADNIILSDFATVAFTPNGTGGQNFTDNGILAVSGFQLGSSPVTVSGLNTTFGLYLQFTGTGTQNTLGLGDSTVGTFSSLNYNLYGYAVSGAVTYLPSDTTPAGVSDPVLLATGALIAGGVGATAIGNLGVVPNANTLLTISPTAASFFESPTPFYNADFAAFTNTLSEVAVNSSGFVITEGGGSANFLEVSEPTSLALLATGFGGLMWFGGRRKHNNGSTQRVARALSQN